MKTTLFLIISILIVSNSQSLKEIVKNVDSQYFKTEVNSSPHLILFYDKGHSDCKSVYFILEEVFTLTEHNPVVKLGKVECGNEPEICKGEGILSFPTLKLYLPNEEGDNTGIKFTGSISTAKSILDFLSRHMNIGDPKERRMEPKDDPKNPGLTQLQEENFLPIISDRKYGFVKFCASWSSKCQDFTKRVWREVATKFQFDPDITVAQVECEENKALCKEYGVKTYPTLHWWDQGVMKEEYPFTKEVDSQTLVNFALKNMGVESVRDIEEYFQHEKDETDIIHLKEEDLLKKINSKEWTFVQFWTAWCSDCERMDDDWESLAYEYNQEVGSVVTVANFDCVRFQKFCEERKIFEFPSLILYHNGKQVAQYEGAHKFGAFSEFLEKHTKAEDDM